MDPQLQQLIELQSEQNQLLRKYLWRIRFSLLTLLILTTAICCGLGALVYYARTSLSCLPQPAAAPFTTPPAGYRPGPYQDLFAPSPLPNSPGPPVEE